MPKVQRVLTTPMYINMKKVITRMNKESRYANNEYSFEADVLKKLSAGNKGNGANMRSKAELIDGRCLLKNVADNEQMQKETLFNLGKTQLVIDNKTGRIIDYYKPFFKSWKKIFKDLDKYLNIFAQNFDNKEVVKQHRLSFSGFTKAGYEKIQSIKAKLNK